MKLKTLWLASFLFLTSLFAVDETTPKSLAFVNQLFPPQEIQIAQDDAGNVTAVFSINNSQNIVLQAAYKPVGGDWILPGLPTSQDNILSPLNYSILDFQLVVDRQGDALVVWRINSLGGTSGSEQIKAIQASYRVFGGEFVFQGNPDDSTHNPFFQDNLINSNRITIKEPPIIAAGDDHAIIAWQTINANNNNIVQTSFKEPGDFFERPLEPTDPASYLNFQFSNVKDPIDLSMDFDGNVAITWQIPVQTNGIIIGPPVVQAAFKLTTDDDFTKPGDPSQQQNLLSNINFPINSAPQTNIDSGNIIVWWTRADLPARPNINLLQTAFKAPGGDWQRPSDVPPPIH